MSAQQTADYRMHAQEATDVAQQASTRRRIFSPGAVVAAAALLVGAGGVAFAAIPAADGTITACYGKNGALRVIDAESGEACGRNESQLTWSRQGEKGDAGPQGPAGPEGPQGPKGDPGGLSGHQIVQSEVIVVPPRETRFNQFVRCPAGKRATGGGVRLETVHTQAVVVESFPASVGWSASVHHSGSSGDVRFRVQAVCVDG